MVHSQQKQHGVWVAKQKCLLVEEKVVKELQPETKHGRAVAAQEEPDLTPQVLVPSELEVAAHSASVLHSEDALEERAEQPEQKQDFVGAPVAVAVALSQVEEEGHCDWA